MAPVLDELFSRRVLFVTGKGGVGKSSMAATLSFLGAQRGQRTLLIDVEGKGDAARFLNAGPPRYEPKQAMDNLWHMAHEPERALDEYLRRGVKLPRLYRIGPVSKVFDFVATAAPGIKEVLIAGKVGYEERATEDGRPRWDLIVVDSAPSGQVLSHLRGPQTLQEIVQVGLIHNQTAWVRKIIEDPERTGIVVVALPEEMPVAETSELLEDVRRSIPTPVLAVIANRVVPPPSHPEGARAFLDRREDLRSALGDPVGRALDAFDLFTGLSEAQRPYVERLRALGPPTLEVPYLPLIHHTIETTRDLAAALEPEAA